MKYKPNHSTLAKIWGRTGENAVFPIIPSTIRAGCIQRTVLGGRPPKQSTLAALAYEVLCRSPEIPLPGETGVVRNEMHPLLALASAPMIAHGEDTPSGGAVDHDGGGGYTSCPEASGPSEYAPRCAPGEHYLMVDSATPCLAEGCEQGTHMCTRCRWWRCADHRCDGQAWDNSLHVFREGDDVRKTWIDGPSTSRVLPPVARDNWVGGSREALEASNHFLPFFGHRILDWRVTFRSEGCTWDSRGRALRVARSLSASTTSGSQFLLWVARGAGSSNALGASEARDPGALSRCNSGAE